MLLAHEDRWWALTVLAPTTDQEQVAGWFYDQGVGGLEFEDGQSAVSPWADDVLAPSPPFLRGYFPDDNQWPSRLARLTQKARQKGLEIAVTAVQEQDWAENWKRYYHPIRPGKRIWVVPAWQDPPDPTAPVIHLNPGMAFGTGTHPTTAMMMAAVERWVKPTGRWLDVGTGSGILALAAWLWGADVTALDPDPVAVRVASENFAAHHASSITLVEGFLHVLPAGESYDGILANLTTDLLAKELPALRSRMRPDGVMVLSGIRKDRHAVLRPILANLGLRIIESRHREGWSLWVIQAA